MIKIILSDSLNAKESYLLYVTMGGSGIIFELINNEVQEITSSVKGIVARVVKIT